MTELIVFSGAISNSDKVSLLIGALTILASVAAMIVAMSAIRSKSSQNIQRENEKLLSEIRSLTAQPGKAETETSGEVSALEYERESRQEGTKENGTARFDAKIEELITNHHEEAINEAKTQFWFSLIAACVGFGFIAITFFVTNNLEWYNKLIMTIPGVVIEAVSALFFSQSKETRERSSDFLNRLREDRKFEKGIEIANTIEDKKLKAKMLASIALSLCSISDDILNEDGSAAEKGEKPPAAKM